MAEDDTKLAKPHRFRAGTRAHMEAQRLTGGADRLREVLAGTEVRAMLRGILEEELDTLGEGYADMTLPARSANCLRTLLNDAAVRRIRRYRNSMPLKTKTLTKKYIAMVKSDDEILKRGAPVQLLKPDKTKKPKKKKAPAAAAAAVTAAAQ